MTSDEHRRALERHVAGLPVPADVLARAVTEEAFDRTVVVEALLMGMADPDPATRWQTVRAVERLVDLDPRLAARLAAASVQDDDVRVRAAAAATLRAHGVAAPGDATSPAVSETSRVRRALLLLRPAVARGGPDIALAPAAGAPHAVKGDVRSDGVGGAVVTLRGMPPELVGCRPALRVAEAQNGPRTAVGAADAPVSLAGEVVVRVPADVLPYETLVQRLGLGVDLEVLDEG